MSMGGMSGGNSGMSGGSGRGMSAAPAPSGGGMSSGPAPSGGGMSAGSGPSSGGMSGGSGGMGANPAVVNTLFGIAAGMSAGMGTAAQAAGMSAAGMSAAGGMGNGNAWQAAVDAQAANGSVGQQWYDMQGDKFKANHSAQDVQNYAKGKGYTLGKAWGGPDPNATTQPPADGGSNEGGSNGGAETYDYGAEMEAMLAPLRTQIEALSKAKETEKVDGSSASGISGKPGYSYTPGGAGNQVGSGVDGTPALFNNWMNSQESLNKASTAYLFSPGGTRRQDEAAAAASSGSSGNNENMKYWNQTDSDLTQTAMSSTQYDEKKEKQPTYFSNGQRAAGSVFDSWA